VHQVGKKYYKLHTAGGGF